MTKNFTLLIFIFSLLMTQAAAQTTRTIDISGDNKDKKSRTRAALL